MRVLTFTSLYPNSHEPRRGIFVKSRMTYFDQIAGTARKVIAPVQYFPLLGLNPQSRFHGYNQVPKEEIQDDIPVYHPRYMTLPGTHIINAAKAMASAAEKIIPAIYPADETFDLIDGHYLYPDGIAAYKLAKKYDKPLILTARGSDVNFWLEQPTHRRDILAALAYASTIICVSAALKDRLIQHGIPESKITVIMNGVDRTIFKAAAQTKSGGEYLLSVGNLVPLKGHEYILRAFAQLSDELSGQLPEEKLMIIGSGALAGSLQQLTRQLNIADKVTFLPDIAHEQLPGYYQKAKGTILMSSMEGMPNVVLESLACGTPVIAANVGGIPEVVTKDNGILLPERTTEALTAALTSALQCKWDRRQIAADMAYLDWQETARKLHHCFANAL